MLTPFSSMVKFRETLPKPCLCLRLSPPPRMLLLLQGRESSRPPQSTRVPWQESIRRHNSVISLSPPTLSAPLVAQIVVPVEQQLNGTRARDGTPNRTPAPHLILSVAIPVRLSNLPAST